MQAGIAARDPLLEPVLPDLESWGLDAWLVLHADPLRRYEATTRTMPKTTEAERQARQRVGQDIFRDALIKFWDGRCPLTGISDAAILRASHMKPWAACESDAERLDVFNGLLLLALWDAAFDRHLMTFTDDGWPEFSKRLSSRARDRPERDVEAPISFSREHLAYLHIHRAAGPAKDA